MSLISVIMLLISWGAELWIESVSLYLFTLQQTHACICMSTNHDVTQTLSFFSIFLLSFLLIQNIISVIIGIRDRKRERERKIVRKERNWQEDKALKEKCEWWCVFFILNDKIVPFCQHFTIFCQYSLLIHKKTPRYVMILDGYCNGLLRFSWNFIFTEKEKKKKM